MKYKQKLDRLTLQFYPHCLKRFAFFILIFLQFERHFLIVGNVANSNLLLHGQHFITI